MTYTWKEIAIELYKILDEIDTADDLAKDNEALYRNLVRHSHRKRFEYGSTDGYEINFKVED